MTDMELTSRQIKMMKHSIGVNIINGKIQNVKNNVYEVYRNYYSAAKQISEWEKLVTNGLATATPDVGDGIIYRLTDKGADKLSEILETKIIL